MDNNSALRECQTEIRRLRGVVRIQGEALRELESLALECIKELVPVSAYRVKKIAQRGTDYGVYE